MPLATWTAVYRNLVLCTPQTFLRHNLHWKLAVAYRGGGLGRSNTANPRNSEDIGGVLDRMSKKNRRLDFLLQFTVFSYGCNLLNKGFF